MKSRVFQGALALTALALSCSAQAVTDEMLIDSFDGPSAGPYSDAEAARFLQQTTFGPTPADIQHLRQLGYASWIDEQFALPASLEVPYIEWVGSLGENVHQPARLEAWFLHVMGGPDPADPTNPAMIHRDQLRQRVAFALSEIFVVSDVNESIGISALAMSSYYDVLIRDAFLDYRQLLEDVTLHATMGRYLSMFRNQKPDPALNIRPDENYAREINQLFSVGLFLLNPDGTRVLQNGEPVPTYDQTTVRGFASVFTGWNWHACDDWVNCYPGPDESGWRLPMDPMESFHDESGPDVDGQGRHYKQLLVYPGVALPQGRLLEGGTARTDLTATLDNIFHHPNVGPFIAKQVIQRLVTSNPTPAFVARVAGVFNDNGQGMRGDLKAMVKAILLDPETRYGHRALPMTFGKVREPLMRLINLWRVTGSHAGNWRYSYPYPQFEFSQAPLRAPSVFNFFQPEFHAPGEVTEQGLVSPEFQIMSDAQVTRQTNDLGHRLVYGFADGGAHPTQVLIDEDADAALAADPTQLLDKYDLLLMSGQMSQTMREVILDELTAIPGGNLDGRRARVQDALYLILNSPEYLIQK